MALRESRTVSESSERMLLAGCLTKPENYIRVIEKITPDHFDTKSHRIIYEAYQKVFANKDDLIDSNIEPVLSTYVRALEIYRDIVKFEYEEVDERRLDNAIRIVDDRYQYRNLLSFHDRLEEYLEDGDLSSTDIINNVNKDLTIIGNKIIEKQQTIDEILTTHIPDPKNVEPIKNEIVGTPSGIRKLDLIISGAEPGDVIYIGGRPSSGKTQLGLQWCLNAAKDGYPVIIFSLETTKERIMNRMLASSCNIDSELIKKRIISKENEQRWLKGYKTLKSLPILVDENPAHTPFSIANTIRKHQFTYGEIGLILIDYIQLIASEHKELKEVTRQFQIIAKSLGVPIILISQLNRAADFDTDWTTSPKMKDFRESGAIEESGFKMLALTSEPIPDDIDKEEVNVVRGFIWVIKNKDGKKSRIPIMNHMNTGIFRPCRMFTKESMRKAEGAYKKGDKRQHFE